MYRYKAEQRWRKFDYTVNKNLMRKDPIIQMLLDIETVLIEAECMRLPIVYIRPEVDKQTVNRMTDIVTNNLGEMTLDEEETTHIIYPVVDPLPEDYALPTFRRDKHVMIHWYYFPEWFDKLAHQKRKRSPSPLAKGGKRKSGRFPAVFQKKTRVDDEESEDMKKDMDDPPAETNL